TDDPAGGTIILQDVPYGTGVNWYELTVTNSAGTVSRTYDFYLSAVASQGVLNPFYAGANQSSSIALNNLAGLPGSYADSTTNQYITDLTIGLVPAGAVTMDPSLLGQILDSSIISAATNSGTWPTPSAPVLGRQTGLGTSTGLNLPTPLTVVSGVVQQPTD